MREVHSAASPLAAGATFSEDQSNASQLGSSAANLITTSILESGVGEVGTYNPDLRFLLRPEIYHPISLMVQFLPINGSRGVRSHVPKDPG